MSALIDSFGRSHTYARISVTDRCNLRCRYCMPPGGPRTGGRDDILTFGEITRLARVLASLGVTKIRLTGGEPLVRRSVDSLVRDLSALEGIEQVVMTTNGVRLSQYASSLRAAGLSRLNVSLDTLRPDRFRRIAQADTHEAVWAGIDAALEAGFAPLKLNVVVMSAVNDDELLDFVELARARPFDVRFIEYMPFTRNGWPAARFVPYATLRSRIEERYDLRPCVETKPSVATAYSIAGFTGSIGFISPMSSHFCDECNRLRIKADGSIQACLFDPPVESVLPALRRGCAGDFEDGEIARIVQKAVWAKGAAHPPSTMLAEREDRSMAEVGG